MSNDSEIIERSIADPAIFAELFERHAAAVGGFARRRIGLDAVDDILSETFLVAFRRRGSFDAGSTSARPWLLGIATRVIHRYRKSEERQWRATAAMDSEPTSASHEGRSDAHLDASAAIRALAPRIAALSQKERDVLLLHAWGDLTYDQIALALRIPVGTVRSRLSRIRRKLAPSGSNGSARLTWMAKEDQDATAGSLG